MSNIIPPMVSSTPPPMDDNLDDDEDDEFGDFASANLSYVADNVQPSNSVAPASWVTNLKTSPPLNTNETLSQDETLKTELKTNDDLTLEKHNGMCGRDSDPTTTDDDEEVECPVFNKCDQADENRTAKCDIMRVREIQQDNTSQDSVVSGATDSGLCSASQNSEGTSPLPHGDEVDRLSPVLNSIPRERRESCSKELCDSDKSQEKSEDSKRTFKHQSAPNAFPISETNISLDSIVQNANNYQTEIASSSESCEVVSSSVTSEPELTVVQECDDRDQFSSSGDLKNMENESIDGFNDFSEYQSTCKGSVLETDVLNMLRNNSSMASKREKGQDLKDHPVDEECDEIISKMDSCISTVTTQNDASGTTIFTQSESLDVVGDDFGDFETATNSFGNSHQSGMEVVESVANHSFSSPAADTGDQCTNSDDEFADFAAASEPLQYFFPESQSLEKAVSSSWADVPDPHAETRLDEVDEDFDDFETPEFHPYEIQSVGDEDKLLERIQHLIKELFPTESVVMSDAASVESKPLMEYLDTISPVWDKLRVIESSHALTYQWSGSSANKALLSSLGIDSRNILFGPRWNASIPRFAANLGFSPLEPVRASGNNVNCQPSPSVPSSSKEPSSSTPSEGPEHPGNEDSVPAAQFDWNSSGLVNPLDCTQSALLDLDYLNTFDNFASPSSSVAAWELASLEKELESPNDVSATATQPSTQTDQLVQRILAAGQSVPLASVQRRDELSPEATKVLDSLPDLSFLRSKMLMFPVHTPSPDHSVSASDG